MPFSLSQQIIALEHLVSAGTKMTGVVPQKDAPANWLAYGGDPGTARPKRDMITWNRPDDTGASDSSGGSPQDGNGLFNPWLGDALPQFKIDESADIGERWRGSARPWLMNTTILCDPAVTWNVYLTSGLRDGSATTLDDPAYDLLLGSGAGTGRVELYFDLLPYQCIRVVTSEAPATTEIRAQLYLGLTNGGGGRFM